jgi:hypothetical protein
VRAAKGFTDRARMRHRIGHAEVPQRNERHHVERAAAPVHTSVFAMSMDARRPRQRVPPLPRRRAPERDPG